MNWSLDNFKRNLKGYAYQINPFDDGKTFSDARRKSRKPVIVDKNTDPYYALSRPLPQLKYIPQYAQRATAGGVPRLPTNQVSWEQPVVSGIPRNGLRVQQGDGMQPFGASFEDQITSQMMAQPTRRSPQTTQNGRLLTPDMVRLMVLQTVFKSIFK